MEPYGTKNGCISTSYFSMAVASVFAFLLSASFERRATFLAVFLRTEPAFLDKRASNVSTRRAESMIFCVPVKTGWHWLHSSVWIALLVEPVVNVFPHAHVTVEDT